MTGIVFVLARIVEACLNGGIKEVGNFKASFPFFFFCFLSVPSYCFVFSSNLFQFPYWKRLYFATLFMYEYIWRHTKIKKPQAKHIT